MDYGHADRMVSGLVRSAMRTLTHVMRMTATLSQMARLANQERR